jgi:CAAX prenyl protease-like protein
MSHFAGLRSPLAAYTVPFLVFMGGLVLASALRASASEVFWLKHPEYWVYPLQTVLCAAAMVFYWRQYDFAKRGGLLVATLAGAVVLGIWIAPQAVLGFPAREDGFDPAVFGEGTALYWMTVVARFARLVVIVPLLEEIFWRGFLMRFLVREDFDKARIGEFQWKAFLLVAVFFMLVHSMADWPAAFLCGLAYNFVAVKTRSLSACVVAHALTNLGLGAYIMATRQWGFW